MPDTVVETKNVHPDLNSLVAAANAEKAARKATELREKPPDVDDTYIDTQDAPVQVDTRGVSQRIAEINYELADLEKKLKAGDRSAAGELAYLLAEQQQLQKSVIQVNQAEHRNRGLEALLQRFIGRPLERLFGAMMAPDNQPLETLRSMAWQSWLNERRAAGKSNLLNIPATLKAMMMMRQSPQELANRITNTRTTTGDTNGEPRVDIKKK